MRFFLLLFIFLTGKNSFSQLTTGYNTTEVRDMIAICNSFTFLELYKNDAEILPRGYNKIYTSAVLGMDNIYQIYINGNIGVINLRGSTDQQLSWMENVYTAMIPARGTIKVKGDTFKYDFARSPKAAVHSGYALAIAYIHKDLLSHIQILNNKGIYNFIITGHSQGGALANLLRAYMENLPVKDISPKNKFKTYAFAAPMTGNKDFAFEYNTRYAANNTSFNIVNPADEVPLLPVSYNDSNYVEGNLQTFLFKRDSFRLRKMLVDGGAILFEKKITQVINWFGGSASKKIGTDLGTVELPPYVKDINYKALNNKIDIPVSQYPYILKDSSILENDSLLAIYPLGNDGYFIDKKLYKKAPWSYQHKPYNYYTSILKKYFPEEYILLKKKVLPENL